MNINDTILYKTEKLLEVSANGLYKWQNDALDIILNNDAVLIAPPNSGKSYVAYNWANIDNPSNRIIITCPTKAKVNDYITELRNSGYDVGISTGDAKNNTDANIIICTQEIYNIFYAKCPDQKVIIDEFHFALNDSIRRNAYMYGIQMTNETSNILIMSATLSDSKYVARELSKITSRNFIGYTSSVRATNLHIHKSAINLDKIYTMRNVLLFAYNIKDVLHYANVISNHRKKISDDIRKEILCLSNKLNIDISSELINCLVKGVGMYYGKMLPMEKLLVTELYKRGILDAIVGTDALSVGVNLPAESVVFLHDRRTRMTDAEIIQQSSRAGRKGFFDTGHVYITSYFHNDALFRSDKKRYCDIGDRISNPVIEPENLSPIDINKFRFDGVLKESVIEINSFEKLLHSIPLASIFLNTIVSSLISKTSILVEEITDDIIFDFVTSGQYSLYEYVDSVISIVYNKYWRNHKKYFKLIPAGYKECIAERWDYEFFDFVHHFREYYYNNSYDLNLCLEIKRLFNEYNYNCINRQIDLSGIDLKIHELDMSVSNFTDALDIIDEYFTESTN